MTTPFGEQPLAIVSAQFTIPQDSIYSENLHSLIGKYTWELVYSVDEGYIVTEVESPRLVWGGKLCSLGK